MMAMTCDDGDFPYLVGQLEASILTLFTVMVDWAEAEVAAPAVLGSCVPQICTEWPTFTQLGSITRELVGLARGIGERVRFGAAPNAALNSITSPKGNSESQEPRASRSPRSSRSDNPR